MTDKRNLWAEALNLGRSGPGTPAEQAFLRDAEQIAEDVVAMSDEDVADYLVEHGLQDLVKTDQIDAVLASALDCVRQRQPGEAPPGAPVGRLFAVRQPAKTDEIKARATGNTNIVRPAFGSRRHPTR